MQDFRKLRVWHDSMSVAVLVYKATDSLPASERFGLRAQMRSAVVSVSSNIAEGCGRPGRRDMARFLGMAIGSACELESQVHITQQLGFLEDTDVTNLLRHVDEMKGALISLYGRVKARAEHPELFAEARGDT